MKKILIFTAVLAAFAFSMSAQYTEIFTQPYPGAVQSLYTSSKDTAAGINYEIADNFLDLADPINKVEFYGACGNFDPNAGWIPGAPNATEPFNLRFYNLVYDWTVPPEPLVAAITGTYTVNLYDDYGDGWNGGLLDVLVNGVVVLDDITLASGAGPVPYTFSANAGDIISTVYTAGSWAYENWYEILDPNLAVIATDGAGGVQPTGLNVPVPLIAAETGTYTVNLYDSWGDGWNGGLLDVYVNGVVALDNITLASGAGPAVFTFLANAGDEIATVFTAGSYSSECSYEILDPNLAVIATDGPGPVGIGFISQMVLFEPTWGTPDYEFALACTSTFVETLDWGWDIYKFEAVLPAGVVLEDGWFSAQIDVDGGGSKLFLFAPGTGLDMFSIQHLYGAKHSLDKETLKKLMMVSSGNTRDDLAADMAFTLYTGGGTVDDFYRVIVEVWNGTDYLGVYNFSGPLTGTTPYVSDPEMDYTTFLGTYTMESPAPAGWHWEFTQYTALDDISDFAQDPNDEHLFTAYVTFNLIEDGLPVELSSFTATVTAINDVELTWVSETEDNMNGYRVYRNTSADQNGSISITPILIPAANTSTTHTYSITDDSVEIGDTYFYWLEAVDYQSSNFHGPVSVTVTGNVPPVLPEITSLKSAYPNPFKANTTIEVSVKAGENGTMTIYNVAGKAVQTYNVTEGTHNLIWNGKDSSGNACGSGIYFYKLTTPSFNQTRKMIIVK